MPRPRSKNSISVRRLRVRLPEHCPAATSRKWSWPGSCPGPLRLFIASQPTRGVDVGSIEFLHKRIVAERDVGTPVMIVSTELDEVIELADRIAVLYKGKLVGIVPAGTPRDTLGLMMAGVGPEGGSDD